MPEYIAERKLAGWLVRKRLTGREIAIATDSACNWFDPDTGERFTHRNGAVDFENAVEFVRAKEATEGEAM